MRIQLKSLQPVLSTLAVALFGFIAVAAMPAHAMVDDYVFGSSFQGVGTQELILNGGSTVIQATDTGWYRNDGVTTFPANTDYIAGNCAACGGYSYHDFFTFNLSGVTGPITSASLSLYNPTNGFSGVATNFIVSNATSLLPALTSGNNSTAIYNALGSGTVFGSTVVNSTSNGTDVDITLNPFAIAALNQTEGNTFALGGRTGISSVPLPDGLPMFIVALLAMVATVQFKNERKLV